MIPLQQQFMRVLPYYAAVLCPVCFFLFSLDKLCAVKGWHRIPERVLLTVSALGGSFGALLAMSLLRHKINGRRHPGFVFGIPLMFLCHLTLVCVLYMNE